MRLSILTLALATGLSAQSLYFSGSLTAVGTTPAWPVASAVNHTLQVLVVSPATCTINLDGSLDGLNFFDLSGPQSCTSSVMFHVDFKPVAYVRANLSAYSGDATGAKVRITYKGSN